jgi:hypothetical protein
VTADAPWIDNELVEKGIEKKVVWMVCAVLAD